MFNLPLNSVFTLATLALLASPAQAQNVANGEKLFKKCKSCHLIRPEARNRTGPNLTGVVGRVAGTFEGFEYSEYMVAAGAAGLVWDQDLLFDYLLSPKKFLRKYLGNKRAKAKMSFRLKDEGDRRDVIAYLATFSAPMKAAAQDVETTGKICVVNGTDTAHFFTAEARGGSTITAPRVSGTLDAGATLCIDAVSGSGGSTGGGMVSVFETPDELEGCSRIVDASMPETLLQYADFDRCAWSSNS